MSNYHHTPEPQTHDEEDAAAAPFDKPAPRFAMFDIGDDGWTDDLNYSTEYYASHGLAGLVGSGASFVQRLEEEEEPEDLGDEELNQVTKNMIALFDSVYDPDLLDPLSYINGSIRTMIDTSSASEELKNRIDGKTEITVTYRHSPSATSGVIDAGAFLGPREETVFTLEEIVSDSYRRRIADFMQVQVEWPEDFPQSLIDTLESANLQHSYQVDVERRLNTPNARFILQLQAKTEVQDRLNHYAQTPDIPEAHSQLIEAYGRGEATLQAVEFRTRLSRTSVAQTLYLNHPDDTSADGLLIFLDAVEEDAVFALPMENRRRVIESSVRLARLIIGRLPLYDQIIQGGKKLRYLTSLIGPYPSYFPPLHFYDVQDTFETLHTFRVKRMLSDIDTLVSTDDERLTDKLLEIGASIFQGLSIVATLPVGGGLGVRLLVSFLLGQTAAALEAVRGASADIPEEASEHYKAALFTAIAELVGPLLGKMLGKAVSAANKSHITNKVFKYMKRTRPLSGKPDLATGKIRPEPLEVKRLKREVAQRLSQGADQAQALVDESSHLINKTVEGHDLVVYHGRVFRGDMRPPEEIFQKGFELRTPAAEIQKDIHQVTGVRGGFGGGHDALDIDGRGISTSAFYKKDGAGAYYYGGHKGGYTYLIDARKFDGYHLYQNHENAIRPNVAARIKHKPLEINFAHDLPATAVLGAYDATGKFIGNQVALRAYARELAIKEIRRLATLALATGAKLPFPENEPEEQEEQEEQEQEE